MSTRENTARCLDAVLLLVQQYGWVDQRQFLIAVAVGKNAISVVAHIYPSPAPTGPNAPQTRVVRKERTAEERKTTSEEKAMPEEEGMMPEREPVVKRKSIALKRESARPAKVTESAGAAKSGMPHAYAAHVSESHAAHMAAAAHAAATHPAATHVAPAETAARRCG